ncbi:MAG: hypothetical protein L3K19_00890 [Thermoplasmata archaeon]|nr:hypothetical protein [Thermoplasmata archaeon]
MSGDERSNPVLPALLLRDLLPFLPVWVFGVVLAVSLDDLHLVGPRLPLGTIDQFAVYYTVLAAGMAAINLLRHYRSAPRSIAIGRDGLELSFGSANSSTPRRSVPFERVRAVYLSGFFGPHLDAAPVDGGWMSMPLTPENAHAVATAWTAWRTPSPPPAAAP